MTVTQTSFTGVFDAFTRDQASIYNILAKAFLGVGTYNQRVTAQAQVANAPDFIWQGKTSTNDSATQIFDLTTLGVTFPANTIRIIELEVFVSGDTEFGWCKHIVGVAGGATPTIETTILTQGSTAGTAGQTPGNFISFTGSGLSGFAVSVALNSNDVVVKIASSESGEVLDWIVKCKVGKLANVLAGV